MLYLVLAIISLWDVAPVPLATAAAQLTSRLESTGLSSQPFARHEPYATFGSLIAGGVCTFGSPPLTSRLYDDAAALYRSFSTPECADERPLMSLDFTKPWIPFGTPVRLEPAPLRPPVRAGIAQPITLHISPAPARSFFAVTHASRVPLPAMRVPLAPVLRR